MVYIGMPDKAYDHIRENGIIDSREVKNEFGIVNHIRYPKTRVHDHCGEHGEFELYEFFMKDGTSAYQYVQVQEFANTPALFIKLIHGSKEFVWSEENMSAVMGIGYD